MKNLILYLRDRTSLTVRIVACIAFDALLFCFWLLIAWGSHALATTLEAKGVDEIFTNAFKWTSSLGTFVLALSYIVSDIVKAFRDFFVISSIEKER